MIWVRISLGTSPFLMAVFLCWIHWAPVWRSRRQAPLTSLMKDQFFGFNWKWNILTSPSNTSSMSTAVGLYHKKCVSDTEHHPFQTKLNGAGERGTFPQQVQIHTKRNLTVIKAINIEANQRLDWQNCAMRRLKLNTLAITSMVTQLTRCSMLAVVLLSAISDNLSISLSAVSLKFPIRLLKYLKKEAFQWYLSVSQVSAVISWMFCATGQHEYINHAVRCVSLCPPSNSQAAECRVHDPTLFVPLLMVPNCYQAISKESSRQKQQGFSIK